MKPNIFVVAPTVEHVTLVEEAARELGLAIITENVELQEALRVARRLLANGIEVIVARGGTARLLQEADLGVPVVEIEVSAYDILRAVADARKYGRRIALMGSRSLIYGIQELSGLIDADILQVPADSYEEATRKWEELPEGGVDCVVGDGLVCRWAERREIPSIPIRSGRNAVFTAMRRSAQALEIRRQEKARADRVKTMIDSVDDAIAAVDETGNIVMLNASAEALFGLKESETIGKPLPSAGSPELLALFHEFALSDQTIRRINGRHVVARSIPVVSGDVASGVIVILQEVTEIQRMETRIRKELHNKGHIARIRFDDIIGQSRSLKEAIRTGRRYAALESTVLLVGETGVGKESFAQAIHNASPRSRGPFVAVNCGALPEELLESELFGYVDGAFTGARKQGKAGLFELAHTGTIFLDEIGHVSPRVQLRLLRVLQEREVMRLGDDRIVPVDVRVIAATNADLDMEVQEGRFRADLFYRLNVLSLSVPPLRERAGDIAALAGYFLKRLAPSSGGPECIEPDALGRLARHPFPGNIRELQNIIERAAALCEEGTITEALIEQILGRHSSTGSAPSPGEGPRGGLKAAERQLVQDVLKQVNGSTSRAAEILGVSRTTVWRKNRPKQ